MSAEPPAPRPELRASDAEREEVAQLLRRHAADGRLDADELEERTAAAYASRTHGELRRLTEDLPALPPAAPAPPRRRRPASPGLRDAIARGAVVTVIAVVVWLAAGAGGDFWPVWVIVGALVFVFARAAGEWASRD